MATIIQLPVRGMVSEPAKTFSSEPSGAERIGSAFTAVMSLTNDAFLKLEQLQLCLEVVDRLADEFQQSPAQKQLRKCARALSAQLKQAAVQLSNGRETLVLNYSQLNASRC